MNFARGMLQQFVKKYIFEVLLTYIIVSVLFLNYKNPKSYCSKVKWMVKTVFFSLFFMSISDNSAITQESSLLEYNESVGYCIGLCIQIIMKNRA